MKKVISIFVFLVAFPMNLFAADCTCKCTHVDMNQAKPINLVLEPSYNVIIFKKKPKAVVKPKEQAGCVAPAPAVVAVPAAPVEKVENPADSKIQYEPAQPDATVLKDKVRPMEEVQGAIYPKGAEMHVAPGTPDHVVKDEVILEKPKEEGQSTQEPVNN